MIIYKYLDEEGAIKTLRKNAVLLRSPVDFNDPFDSIFYVDENKMKEAYQVFINYQIFKKVYDELIVKKKKANVLGIVNRANIIHDAPIVKRDLKYEPLPYLSITYKIGLKYLGKTDQELKASFEQTMSIVMDNLRKAVLISCFGLKNNSLLMWSHYADKHKGACIEYEIEDSSFKVVKYSEQLQEFRLVDALKIILGHDFARADIDTNDPRFIFLADPVLTKAKDWSYEAEVRCIYSKTKLDPNISFVETKKEKLYLLKMPIPKAIYLGCNAEKEFIEKISNIARDIPIKRMKKVVGKYALEVE